VTPIVKWDPFREFDLMLPGIRRMLPLSGPAYPAADVYETADEFVVELEVPGFEEKELEIEITDHVLSVKGEHEETTEKKERSFRLHERLEKTFERQFALPETVDTDKLAATFRKGVLELHAPKVERLASKKIPIEVR
jgi:HSP20 family protein